MDRGLLTFCTPLQIPKHLGLHGHCRGPGSELLGGHYEECVARETGPGLLPCNPGWGARFLGSRREELWGRGRGHCVLQGHTDELWGSGTHPFQNRFLTCGHDRQLCLWDGRAMPLAWSIDPQGRELLWSPDLSVTATVTSVAATPSPISTFLLFPKGSHLALV